MTGGNERSCTLEQNLQLKNAGLFKYVDLLLPTDIKGLLGFYILRIFHERAHLI